MLGDERYLDETERWVDSWETQIEERLRQARELSQRVSELTATGRSSDGLVEVAVTEILRRKPIDALQEIKIVKDGQVIPFYPFTS